ncbi:MAG: class I SAM-dependent methyltransferase [Gemmatales bacterium]
MIAGDKSQEPGARINTSSSIPGRTASASTSGSVEFFHSVYEGKAPWEIDAPQPAIIELEETSKIKGTVLDIGCGTGCNAIYLAERGHTVTGFDLVPQAIELAKARLGDHKLPITFLAASVLNLPDLGQQFDTAIDAGVFHVFNDKDRVRYCENIHRCLKPGARLYLICFRDDQPGTEGPRRMKQQEIRDCFTTGWQVESIEPSVYMTQASFYGPAKAWLVTITRM